MGGSSSHIISVKFDEPVYRGGERVSGRVMLRVLLANKVNASELRIKFKCRERSSVWVSQQRKNGDNVRTVWHEHCESVDIIAPQEFVLLHFDAGAPTLSVGDYVFPFSMNLPPGCPASFGFQNDRHTVHRDSCNLRYTFEAFLSCPGTLFGQTVHASEEADLHVEGPSSLVPDVPTQLAPRADRLAICCCVPTGTLFSGGTLSSTTVSNGQHLSCLLALENHSTCHVKAVEVVLVEEVVWRAHGHIVRKRFERFRQRLSPEEMGLSTAAPLREKEANLNEESVLRRIHCALLESTGGVWAIPIQNYTNTYSSRLITIKHTLSIKLCTNFGVNNVETVTNIVVQSPPAVATGPFHKMGSYEIPNASAPMAVPDDWRPREYATLPMAQPVFAPPTDGPAPVFANAAYAPSAPPFKSEP